MTISWKFNPFTGKLDAVNTPEASPLTTKGDIYTYDSADARLPVGGDGQILSSDSGEGTGLKWIDAAGGTDVKVAIDSGATADYLGAASNDGALRVNAPISYADGGNFITLGISADGINDTHIDWGTGANQVSAADVPIADGGDIITATDVEGALQENRTAIDLNTAKDTNVPTELSTGTVNATTYAITSDGGADDVTLVEADTDNAGLLGAAKWNEIVANTAKVTNATHTGDVTGATELTIGADKVNDTHIDWGVGANQVSAIDVPIADAGTIITATEVEGALQENRTAIDLNTTHASSDGSDHSFIDQDVTSGSTPTFTGTNITAVASITAADESADTSCFPLFVTSATGTVAGKTGTNLTFNSNTGLLTATTIAGANVTTGEDPGHTHTGASLSSIDISADTNLVAGTNITLVDDTLNVDDAFIVNNADDTTSGSITHLADNKGVKFGAGSDAFMYYDGTDLQIDPAVVGTGGTVFGGTGTSAFNDDVDFETDINVKGIAYGTLIPFQFVSYSSTSVDGYLYISSYNLKPTDGTMGYNPLFDGTIVGVSVNAICSAAVTPGLVTFYSRISGNNKLGVTINITGTGAFNAQESQSQSAGDDFTTSDVIQGYYDEGAGVNVTLSSIIFTVWVVLQP